MNTAIGSYSLMRNTTGERNTAIGINASNKNTTGNKNTTFGISANYYNQTGSNNTIIGSEAGRGTFLHSKSGNVFIGYQAGFNDTTDNKLYIDNSDTIAPLIWGDFENDTVRINGTLDIAGTFHFPTSDGTNGQILKTDGSGNLTWTNNAGSTALQWADTSNQLATDYDVSFKQDISDTSTVDATRYWVEQQGYLTTALQWSDTSNQLATDYDISSKQNISDTSTVDATRYWVNQQAYYSSVAINDLADGKTVGNSLFLGSDAGAVDDSTDNNNVAVGIEALKANTSGFSNTAIGYRALFSNSTGWENTATGYNALGNNNDGRMNTALGNKALESNTSAHLNSAFGYSSLQSNTDGGSNTASGGYSLLNNSSGDNNTANGYSAAFSNTSGNNNIAIGSGADYNNNGGSNNIIIGSQAGFGSGAHNKSGCVFLGYMAGFNEHGSNKLYIENSNSSSPLIWGDFTNDTVRINGTLDIAGAFNFPTSDGTNGQVLKTDGGGTLSWSEATGATSITDLTDAISAGNSVFLGSGSGITDDSTDNKNVAVGIDALRTNSSGFNNTALGYGSSYFNSNGSHNIAIGYFANLNNTGGSYNTIIGYEAGKGSGAHSKSGNIFLGYQAGKDEPGSNKLYIDNSDTTKPLIGGDFSANEVYLNGNAGINTTSPTAKLDVNGATGYDQLRMRTSFTPSGTSDSNGNTGDMAWDDDFIYIKTSEGWKRATLSTW